MGSEIIQDEEAMKRIEELVVSDRSSTMLVCVQGTEEGDLVLKLDEMCNWVGMPHATTDPRFLNLETERRYREASSHHPQADRSNLTYTMDQIPFKQALKAREVLIIYVKYRQFSSLQGSIRGKITKGKVVNFRSALELMRMISMIQL